MPLFEDVERALEAVSEDLAHGFSGIFEGSDDLRPVGRFAEEAMGTVSDTASVLAWEWPVVHVGMIQGTAATNRELTLRGVTVIERRETVVSRGDKVIDGDNDSELLFSRYIDWLALYAELGALAIGRPQVDDRSSVPENVPFPNG
jgi:hypothetical protein